MEQARTGEKELGKEKRDGGSGGKTEEEDTVIAAFDKAARTWKQKDKLENDFKDQMFEQWKHQPGLKQELKLVRDISKQLGN